MEVLAQSKGLDLRWRAGDHPRLLGDPVRLRQVLVNLIGNAIKFTEKGTVEVEMSAPSPLLDGFDRIELQFTVRDSGIGIPEEKQKLIFEPFRQADGSTSRRYGGTGLGLAICARLVDLMGGRIWVESQPGAGSSFFFTTRLRRAPVEQLKPAHSSAPPIKPLSPLRVLVAEDNPVNRKLATRILQNAGHTVVCALDGQEAIDALSQEHFDIVLMDVQMPRMDGFEATSEIRKRDAALSLRTPIVALTANAMKGDRQRCLDAGMDGYVSKPLRSTELLEVMAEIFEQVSGRS
jgi:CheY-like chemotaxis protein